MFLLIFRVDWNDQCKHRSLPLLALHFNVPMVQKRRRLHDIQPQPGAARLALPRFGDAIEPFEDPAAFLFCDPLTGIANLHAGIPAVPPGLYPHMSAIRRILDRIFNQIGDCMPQVDWQTVHRPWELQRALQRNPLLLGDGLQPAQDLRSHLVQRRRFHLVGGS